VEGESLKASGVGGEDGGGDHAAFHAHGGNDGQGHSQGTLTHTGNILNRNDTLHKNCLLTHMKPTAILSMDTRYHKSGMETMANPVLFDMPDFCHGKGSPFP
jgi:hypothetical protein